MEEILNKLQELNEAKHWNSSEWVITLSSLDYQIVQITDFEYHLLVQSSPEITKIKEIFKTKYLTRINLIIVIEWRS